MPFDHFIELIEILNEGLKDEINQKMIFEAFGAWQLIETLKAMFTEKATATKFGSYLDGLGLVEKKETDMTTIQLEKRQALANAEEILKIYRGGKKIG